MRRLVVFSAFAACLPFACARPDAESDSAPEGDSGETAAHDEQPAQQRKPEFLAREQFEAGWIQLFDGHSPFGWMLNSETNWTIRDGAVRAAADEEPGLVLTTSRWADFELRCDVRLEKGGNSGIFLRTMTDPQDPAVDCYEFNLCDTHQTFPTGSLVGRKKVETDVAADGKWSTVQLRVTGNTIEGKLDGKSVLQYEESGDDAPRIGYIGLQKNEGRVAFRNVVLRPLNTEPIFNGENLDGWRDVPGSESEFRVTDGAIHVTGGPGFLETDQTWDDFVLQLEAKTNGENLNSGVFFRAMRGTEEAPSNGYELQIHNGHKPGDPTRPTDYGSGFGTGAIFRRRPARRVVPEDKEWFTLTLVADGPHFASWANGYPVADWTDERPPHENPRRGQRLQAGHISLQGHDPSTDLLFRNLRIAELPE